MRRIAPEARIIVERTGGHEVNLLATVRVRCRAAADAAKARRPPAPRHDVSNDKLFATYPSQALKGCMEYCVSVGSGSFAALGTMALADWAKLAIDREFDSSAETTALDHLGYGTLHSKPSYRMSGGISRKNSVRHYAPQNQQPELVSASVEPPGAVRTEAMNPETSSGLGLRPAPKWLPCWRCRCSTELI